MVGGSGGGEFEHLLFLLVAPLFEERRERVEAQVAAADEPLVVLFDDEAGRESDQ